MTKHVAQEPQSRGKEKRNGGPQQRGQQELKPETKERGNANANHLLLAKLIRGRIVGEVPSVRPRWARSEDHRLQNS